MLTTETSIGHIIFNTFADAETFILGLSELKDAQESFEIRVYQGNRFHIARYFRGVFDGYC